MATLSKYTIGSKSIDGVSGSDYVAFLTDSSSVDLALLSPAVPSLISDVPLMTYLIQDQNVVDEFASSSTAMNSIASDTTIFGLMLNSVVAETAMAASTIAMTAIIGVSAAMTSVAADASMMALVAASSDAMDVVAADTATRMIIDANTVATTAIGASSMATAKYIAGSAGLDPVDYPNMTTLLADTTAMNLIVNDVALMTMLSQSTDGMTAFAADTTLMSAAILNAKTLAGICSGDAGADATFSYIQSNKATVISTMEASLGTVFNKYTETYAGSNTTGVVWGHYGENNMIVPYLSGDQTDAYTNYVSRTRWLFDGATGTLLWTWQGNTNQYVGVSNVLALRGIGTQVGSPGWSKADPKVSCYRYAVI